MHPVALLYDCEYTVRQLKQERKIIGLQWINNEITWYEHEAKYVILSKLIYNFSAFIPLQKEIKKNVDRLG